MVILRKRRNRSSPAKLKLKATEEIYVSANKELVVQEASPSQLLTWVRRAPDKAPPVP